MIEVQLMNDMIKRLISKYQSRNPIDIIEGMNIKLIYSDLGCNIRGFYQYFKRGRIIYVNSTLNEYEQKQVMRHELGHAVLHTKTNRIFMELATFQIPNKYENEADLFATFLAISDEDVNDYIECRYTVQQISDMTGCKAEFVERRIQSYLQ
jgi:Zn-dependent peptidase ImmA (M78 family)